MRKAKQPPNLVQHPPNGGYASQTAFKGTGSALNGFVAFPIDLSFEAAKRPSSVLLWVFDGKVGSAGTELQAKASFGMTDSTYI